MAEDTQMRVCHQCQNVFKLPPDREAECPRCGSRHTEAMSSWVPIGFTSRGSDNMWEYECQQCHQTFQLPIPSSPSLEKEARCPACGGKHIHRLTPTGFRPLYCG